MMHLHVIRATAFLLPLSILACTSTTAASLGAPCGNAQYASATAILPDTGIDAGHQIQISFIQHDPDLSGELSEVAIQQAWPAGAAPDTEPDPRVRLMTASGQVLLDTLGTRLDQPSGMFDRPTWMVLQWLRDAKTRNALYEAFATQSLWLGLSLPTATVPGTRVLLTTKDYGVTPPHICG
jgi:hypothetical protein